MTSRRTGAILVLIAAAATFGGCIFDVKKDTTTNGGDPVIYLPQTSAVNVLDNLKTAYINRNYDEYVKLFADDYSFWFSAEDVGDPNDPTPEVWFLDDEKVSAERLFSDDTVDKITLDFRKAQLDSVAGYPDQFKMFVTEVQLRVETRQGDTNDPITYVVSSGRARFYFRETTETTDSGQKIWKIYRWEDNPDDSGKMIAASDPR